jgi:beta-phosphoglucomutase-like phosphatase (HAD superfamily)
MSSPASPDQARGHDAMPVCVPLGQAAALAAGGTVTAILFDWDGTLVDSTEANYLSLHEALAAHGHDLARDWFLARTGLTTAQTVQEYCTQFGLVVDHDRVVQQVNSAFRRHRAGIVEVTAVSMLLRKRPANVKTALVSGSTAADVTAVAERLDLLDLFDAVVTADDVAQPKPAPDGYRLALNRLAQAPSHALAIEDTDEGIQAARAAGIAYITDVRRRMRFPV